MRTILCSLALSLQITGASALTAAIETTEANYEQVARFVARVGKPLIVHVPAGTPVRQAVEEVCPLTDAYVKILLEHNGSLSSFSNSIVPNADIKITIPACVAAPKSADVVKSAIARAAAPVQEPSKRDNSIWSEVSVAEGQDRNAVLEVVQSLRASSDIGGGTYEKSALLVTPPAVRKCTRGVFGESWPIDAKAVLRQLALTKLRFTGNYGAQTILILDTGFDQDNKRILDAFPNKSIGELRGLAARGPTCCVNLARSRDGAATPANYPSRWHGVSVADVALGTKLLHVHRSLTSALPQVAFASMLDDRGDLCEFPLWRLPQLMILRMAELSPS